MLQYKSTLGGAAKRGELEKSYGDLIVWGEIFLDGSGMAKIPYMCGYRLMERMKMLSKNWQDVVKK